MDSPRTTLILLMVLAFTVLLSRGKIQEIISRLVVAMQNKNTAMRQFQDELSGATGNRSAA